MRRYNLTQCDSHCHQEAPMILCDITQDCLKAPSCLSVSHPRPHPLPSIEKPTKATLRQRYRVNMELHHLLYNAFLLCLLVPTNAEPLSSSSVQPSGTRSVSAGQGICKALQVEPGDGCWMLAQRCRISLEELTRFNPHPTFCSNLHPRQWICCSSGTLPVNPGDPGETPSPPTPVPDPNEVCNTYTIKTNDYCYAIALNFNITIDQIYNYNKKTWGWAGCNQLQTNQRICLSPGHPPMPAPVPNAVCGPQVPGTKEPPRGTDLSTLNQCPGKICCNVWGQCGTSRDFCVRNPADTGAPGTSQPGANGCISNCNTN
ncbi:hypothetical protein BDV25DRAFT_147998, partial [Aspergillus avenaceus]